MKYLCVFDMDETLLSPDKTISSENKKALSRLRELDIGITIATARSPFLVGKYIDLLSLELPIIACNGGMLITSDFETVIWENPIDKTHLSMLFRYLLDQKADFFAYTKDKVFHPPESVHIRLFKDYNKTVPVHRQGILQGLTCATLENSLPDIVKILLYEPTAEQDVFLRSVPGLEVLPSMANVLDIMQDGSTKGNAVFSLSKYLDIPIENIAVFGDSENDISMLTCGALGIAMGNSNDNIKQHAAYVTGTNLESGVAQAIYNFVLPYFGM